MADLGEQLKAKVNIAGKEIPVWVLVLGALVAVFAVVTKGKGGQSFGAVVPPAEPVVTDQGGGGGTGGGGGGGTTQTIDTSAIDDAISQLNAAIGASQKNVADVNAQFQQTLAQQNAQFQSALQNMNAQFAQDRASQQASISAAAPIFSAPPPSEPVYQAPAAPAYRAPTPQPTATPAPTPPPKPIPVLTSQRAAENPELQTARNWQQRNQPSGGDTYTVVGGDTLSRIARTRGMSLSQLIAKNPQISNPNLIRVGQVINV